MSKRVTGRILTRDLTNNPYNYAALCRSFDGDGVGLITNGSHLTMNLSHIQVVAADKAALKTSSNQNSVPGSLHTYMNQTVSNLTRLPQSWPLLIVLIPRSDTST